VAWFRPPRPALAFLEPRRSQIEAVLPALERAA
jgi:hypothetical protein